MKKLLITFVIIVILSVIYVQTESIFKNEVSTVKTVSPTIAKVKSTAKKTQTSKKVTTSKIKNKTVQKKSNKEYKLIAEKREDDLNSCPIIMEIFYANDKDYKGMKDFSIKKDTPNTWYVAVFVDDPKYAVAPQYPITSLTWDLDNYTIEKHIIAIYQHNHMNGYQCFDSYKKNLFEG